MSKNNIITTVVITIIIGGLAFFGGMKYQASKAQAQGGPGTANQRQMFRNTAGRGGAGAGFLNGQITSKDNSSLTIKDRNGNSRIVLYSASTTIGKVATGTPDDLTVGSPVSVIGQTDSNTNTITAQSINLTPAGFPGFGNRVQGQNGNTPPAGTAPFPANQ